MARLIWTEPALNDLEAIADYIGLDKPEAARRYVQRVFHSVERLLQFPKSGRVPRELPRLSYREIVISPCRIFYRKRPTYDPADRVRVASQFAGV
jgi:toxin ParE1/3/4